MIKIIITFIILIIVIGGIVFGVYYFYEKPIEEEIEKEEIPTPKHHINLRFVDYNNNQIIFSFLGKHHKQSFFSHFDDLMLP